MKKLILFVLIFSMAVAAFPQTATAADSITALTPEYEGFFKSFSVFPNLENPEKEFTRGEMAAVVSGVLSYRGGALEVETAKNITDTDGCEYAVEIAAAVESGIMSGYDNDDKTVSFRPYDTITLRDIIKVLVSMLGYEPMARINGGSPMGYLETARSIGLLTNQNPEAAATAGDAAALVYKALHTKIPDYYITDNGIIDNTKSDAPTYIEAHWNISYDDGVLQCNPIMSIDGTQPTSGGTVKIDGVLYDSMLLYENTEYLGQTVRYYIDNTNPDSDKIVCMYPLTRKNEIVYAKSGEVFDLADLDKVKISRDDGEQSLSISKDALVYENFKYSGPADKADMAHLQNELKKGALSDLTLIDNDGDGSFDIVWVKTYTDIVVKEFNFSKFEIKGKYGESLEMKKAYDKDKVFLRDENGQLFNPKDIEKNVVLSVICETNAQGEITRAMGFGSTLQVSGVISEVSEDGAVIGGESYLESPLYQQQIILKNTNVKKLKAGLESTFLLNKFNMIAAINMNEVSEQVESSLGFISKYAKFPGVSEIVKCTLYNTDGNASVAEFADKVTINGKSVRGNAQIYDTLTQYAQQQNLLYRLVKYKMVNEKITYLDIYAYAPQAETSEKERDDELYPDIFIRSNENTARTVFKSGTIGKRVGLTAQTVIFAVPAVESKIEGNPAPDLSGIPDDAVYSLSYSNLILDYVFGEITLPANTGASAATNKMQMAFYDVDETLFSNIAIRYYEYNVGDTAAPDTPNLNSDVLVVEKISKGLNADGEDVTILNGYRSGTAVRIYTRPTEGSGGIWGRYPALKYLLENAGGNKTAAEDVRPGDAVLLTLNSNGEATNILVTVRAGDKSNERWLDGSSPSADLGVLNEGHGNQYLGVNYGKVSAYNDSKIVLDELDGVRRVYSLGNVNVTVYEREKQNVYKGSMSDIEVGDDVYIRQYYSNIKEVVLYK